MENQKVAIGVDIGGTSIRAGVVSNDGALIGESYSIPTNALESDDRIVARIVDAIVHVKVGNNLDNQDILGIGLGVTGPLDVKNGKILQCPNLPTMDFYPLRDAIEQKMKLPVSMNNDANAMMLGETLWGAGKGSRCVLGITLGTGFGCAMVLDRKVWMGSTETAGEIWISPYQNGMIEDIVSGKGVSRLYEKLTHETIPAKEVASRALNGDSHAKSVWVEFGQAVAYALAWSVNMVDPDMIIIGGSMANAMDLFYEAMYIVLCKNVCPIPAQNLRIEKAQLGDNAGFIGAAALVF